MKAFLTIAITILGTCAAQAKQASYPICGKVVKAEYAGSYFFSGSTSNMATTYNLTLDSGKIVFVDDLNEATLLMTSGLTACFNVMTSVQAERGLKEVLGVQSVSK